MKRAGLLTWMVAIVVGTSQSSAEEDGAVQLRGVASFSTNCLALLEVRGSPHLKAEFVLSEGQRDGDLEVLKIDFPSGKVKVRNAGQLSELIFDTRDTTGNRERGSSNDAVTGPFPQPPFLRLQQAASGSVFYLYQHLVARSLIRSKDLPTFRLDLNVKAAATSAQLADAIEKGLRQKGIALTPDRDKFVLACRTGDSAKVTPLLWELAVQLGRRVNDPEETMPEGMVDFLNADLNQVLQLYQELVNRTLIRAPILPTSIAFRSYTPLTLTEAIYSFHLIFAANDMSIAPAGKKFLCLLPTSKTNMLVSLLAERSHVSASNTNTLPAGIIDCRAADLQMVASLYKGLSGQTVEVEPGLPRARFTMKSQTPLLPEEAIQGLNLLLGLQGFSVVPQRSGQGLVIVRAEGY